MAIQIIIQKEKSNSAELALREIWEEIELFELNEMHTGISIPTKSVDRIGEVNLKEKLANVHHYDLWEGKWNNL